MVRASFPDFPYIFNKGTWPAQWKRDLSDGGGNGYDPNTGIETLTLDMNGYADFQNDYDTTKATECGPANFCALTGTAPNTTCTCQLGAADPLFNDCQSVCTKWAAKDVKCPNNQCFGFSIKMADNFAPIPKNEPRPQAAPGCFSNNIFNIAVTPAAPDLAGTCANPLLPITQICN